MNTLIVMRLIVVWLAVVSLVPLVQATPPGIEPLDQAIDRFGKEHIPQYETLLHELRARLRQENREKTTKNPLDDLAKYVLNITSDDIPGIQRAIQSGSDEALATWLRRLTMNLTGFRRTIDRLLVENQASNRLRLDESFLGKLKKYWDEEEYFSWRFSHEADRRTPPAKPLR